MGKVQKPVDSVMQHRQKHLEFARNEAVFIPYQNICIYIRQYEQVSRPCLR
jgi:hypothetical protein